MMTDQHTGAEKIRWVARAIHEPEVFKKRAKTAADQLGPETIDTLAELLHSEHRPPDELADQFSGLGQWIAARQFAIFEMYYHFGEAALPVLRKVAFGEYDWTQGNAIEILCRLAAKGIDREEIIADIRRAFPKLRYEAQLYAVGPLLEQAEVNPTLAMVLQQFEDLQEYRDTVAELGGSQ